jgi:hypothetical protein
MSEGGLYIAAGRGYIEEAEKSAESFKQAMDDTPLHLISDEKTESAYIDSQTVVDDFSYDFGDIVTHIDQSPFEKTIYFDTDLYIDADISEVFELLDEFDVAASMDNHGWHVREYGLEHPINGVPEAFPWYNGGVLAFRDNDRTRDFFETWQRFYRQNKEQGINHNMISLRSALYHSDVRISTLPWRYNCLIRKGNKISGPVKMFHGRLDDFDAKGAKSQHNTAEIRDELNKTTEPRLYIPTKYESVEVVVGTPLYAKIIDYPSNMAVRAVVSIRENGLRDTAKKLYRHLS